MMKMIIAGVISMLLGVGLFILADDCFSSRPVRRAFIPITKVMIFGGSAVTMVGLLSLLWTS